MKALLKTIFTLAIINGAFFILGNYFSFFYAIAIFTTEISILFLFIFSASWLMTAVTKKYKMDSSTYFRGAHYYAPLLVLLALVPMYCNFSSGKEGKGVIHEIAFYKNNNDLLLWLDIKVSRPKFTFNKKEIINLSDPKEPTLILDINDPYPWKKAWEEGGGIFNGADYALYLKQNKDTLWFWNSARGIHTKNLYTGRVIQQELEKEYAKEIKKKAEIKNTVLTQEIMDKHINELAMFSSDRLYIDLSKDDYKFPYSQSSFELLEILTRKPLEYNSTSFTIKKQSNNYKLICTASDKQVLWQWTDINEILEEARGGYGYKDQIIVFTNRYLICFSLKDGVIQWQYKI